ncbi:MAG: putative addiction module CopG family antidote [Planctomycetota bacterium]|jgi:putative addiction module CopG family antidote
MASNTNRRATTLSISITPELASEVARRVESGLYSSASELFREALRTLLRAEAKSSPESQRLNAALEMQESAALWARDSGGIPELELRRRMAELSLEQELRADVRLAPERTARILRGPNAEK